MTVGVDWTYLAQNMAKGWSCERGKNIRLQTNWVFFTSWESSRFSRKSLLIAFIMVYFFFAGRTTVLNYMSLMGLKQQSYVLRTTCAISLKQ
jgi:hypothetical protein